MIKNLKLTDFRNYSKKEFMFSEGTTVIVGPNAIGKTNILEAIYLLSTGRSFKTTKSQEVIQYEKDLARISGAISYMPYALSRENHKAHSVEHDTFLEVIVTNKTNGWPGKRLLVNNIPRLLVDFAGKFKTVLFAPSDMDLVTSSPSLRRKFLDTVLSQADREYRRSLLSYEKGIRQRNRLLFRIREEGLSRSQLLFWNQLLIKSGNYISESREKFIEFVNNLGKVILEYDKSIISEGRLEQYAREEIASATTLVGPHRDDFSFQIRNSKYEIRNLASYGSRGEQRMAVLWLKMAELAYVEAPTLLLDDIFSELDHEHRDIVLDIIRDHQVIMTTADKHFVPTAVGNSQLTIINL